MSTIQSLMSQLSVGAVGTLTQIQDWLVLKNVDKMDQYFLLEARVGLCQELKRKLNSSQCRRNSFNFFPTPPDTVLF